MPVTPADIDAAVPPAGVPNRGLTNTALKGLITDIAAVGVGVGIGTVNTYADLPAPATVTGERWWVLTSTGVWLVNRRTKGAYYSDGAVWSYLGDFPITAAEIGNVPAGGIAAVDLQSAVDELDTDKAPKGAVGSTGITMSTARLLGRSTASTGAIEEITLGTNLSFTGTTLNAAGGGGGSPGGSPTQVQYNSAGVFAGASKTAIGTSGNLVMASNATQPVVPPADTLGFYARRRAGQDWPEIQRPSGREIPLQPHFGLNRIGMWAPATGANPQTLGLNRTGVGTASHPTLASTNLVTSISRWRQTSAATANSVADERGAANQCWRGNAAGLGGWTYTNRISLTTLQTGSVAFFGLAASTSAFSTTQTVAALVNVVGIGFTNGVDTNWQLIHNDGTGAPTQVDLGASFPVSSTTNLYTLVILSAPNGSSIGVRVTEEVSGTAVEYDLTTDIPSSTTFLNVRNFLHNGGVAAAVAYDCSGVYLERDY